MRGTSLNTCQGFNLRLRLFDSRRRMFSEMSFQGCSVGAEFALRTMELDGSQAIDTVVKKQFKVVSKSIFTNPYQLSNLRVGKVVAF